jgi:hypothetical protein
MGRSVISIHREILRDFLRGKGAVLPRWALADGPQPLGVRKSWARRQQQTRDMTAQTTTARRRR